MINIQIHPSQIYRDSRYLDPITIALFKANHAELHEIQIETHWNQIPPNHDWGLWIGGKRYTMTYDSRRYYTDWAIHTGNRTEPAWIHLCTANLTVDIREIRDYQLIF